MLREVDLGQMAEHLAPGAGRALMAEPEAAALIRGLAATQLPCLNLRATRLRYRRYLDYLDELAEMHGRELAVVDLALLRRRGGL
jgi:hypothetical protein